MIGRSCGSVLVVVAALVGLFVVGGFLVLRDVTDDVGSGFGSNEVGNGFGCSGIEGVSGIRFVDRAADGLSDSRGSTPSLVVTGDSPAETATIALAPPDGTQSVLYPGASVSIDPGGRFLIVHQHGAQQHVLDLVDDRVVAEILGDSSDFVFTGPGRGVLFVGAPGCRFGGAQEVDFDAGSSRGFVVDGVKKHIRPRVVLANTIVANRAVPGDSAMAYDGVVTVDLTTGRATLVASSGYLVTTSASPARLWVREGDTTRVVDLFGSEVSRSSDVGVAVGLPDGTVAYVGADGSGSSAIRLAAADGPAATDPVVANRTSVSSLLAGPVPGTLVVGWFDRSALRGGYDVCDLATSQCQVAFEAERRALLTAPLGLLSAPLSWPEQAP